MNPQQCWARGRDIVEVVRLRTGNVLSGERGALRRAQRFAGFSPLKHDEIPLHWGKGRILRGHAPEGLGSIVFADMSSRLRWALPTTILEGH